MSCLKFIATKQKLVEVERPFVVASSIKYLTANFEFSPEWEGCTNTAVFRKEDGKTFFSVQLDENNSCVVPWEVIECPYFTVSVFGNCGDKRITTNRVTVKVAECGYAEGQTPEEPTPSVYEEIINKLDSISGFTGDYNDLTNKPSKLSDFENDANYISEEADPVFAASPAAGIKAEDIEKWNSGGSDEVLPIEKGGTGATTVEQAWTNLKIYTDISQLGLSYKTTSGKIFQAMPVGSIGMFAFESRTQTITDMPCSMGILTIFYPVANRPLILCQQCVSTGGAYTSFHVGYSNNSSKSIVWYSVRNGSMETQITQGGTGANTAEKALQNLGAAKSADIGDVTTLATTDKTIVGAINELYSLINTGG